MIKKNLFILFCFYLFVLQSAICGILRGESKFYILAWINFVILLLIALLSKWSDTKVENDNPKAKIQKEEVKQKVEPKHNEYEVKESIPQQVYFTNRHKSRQISPVWFLIIALLAWIFIWFWLWDIALHLRLLISVAWSYLVYIILWKILWSHVFLTWESRTYILAIIWCCIFSIVKLFSIDTVHIDEPENLNPANSGFVNEIDIVWTWTQTWDIQTWSVQTWLNQTWTTQTWNSLTWDTTIAANTGKVNSADSNKLATFRDVIKYLLADENLITTTNVSFQNISKTDSDYKYFRTAYDKRMIWSDLNPNKNPSCETFVVMKWLAQWWNVWSYSDVKQAYRKYASSHNALPGCKYGSYIKIWEMK